MRTIKYELVNVFSVALQRNLLKVCKVRGKGHQCAQSSIFQNSQNTLPG
jgi:hypothetical protein